MSRGQEASSAVLMASRKKEVLVGEHWELKGHWDIKHGERGDLEKDGKMKFNTIKI